MKNEEISKQFKTMGNLLIGQSVFAVVFLLLLFRSESIESSENLYIVGSMIQLIFFTAYVNWWFVTGQLFSNSSQETDLGIKNFSALNKPQNHNINLKFIQKVFIIIAFLILVILYWTY